jgi:hypothetical protein
MSVADSSGSPSPGDVAYQAEGGEHASGPGPRTAAPGESPAMIAFQAEDGEHVVPGERRPRI